MGNESSSPVNDNGTAASSSDYYGYRVLGVQENSPSSNVGFVSFFDFITSAQGIRLDQRDTTFLEIIGNHKEKPLSLTVFNIKSQSSRNVTITPSDKWAGKGLLGVTIRFDSYESADDELIHIIGIDTTSSSPAAVAGLIPNDDYILGTPDRVFRDMDEFDDEVLDHVNSSFQAYVYNVASDEVRIVTLSPSSSWNTNNENAQDDNNTSVLGAEIGFGYLHRLPASCRNTTGTSVGFVSISPNVTAATEEFENKPEVSESNTSNNNIPSITPKDVVITAGTATAEVIGQEE